MCSQPNQNIAMSLQPNPGLEGVIAAETQLSEVRGDLGELRIAGYLLADWVTRYDYVEAGAALWHLASGENNSSQQLRQQLGQARLQAYQTLHTLRPRLNALDPLEAMRLGLAYCNAHTPIDIIASMSLAFCLYLNPELSEVDADAEHLEDLLRMIRGQAASIEQRSALQSYLLSVADHGLNASTFTARVIASTQSDMNSAVLGAIGALKGPLHGGAPGPVLDMLDAIGTADQAENWLTQHLASGQRVMGFGHRVYRARDPRADVLKAALQRLRREHDNPRLQEAEAIEAIILARLKAHKPERVLQTNVEYYTALLLDALGFERQSFTAVFALGRVLGWCAHVMEQQRSGRLIRPKAQYVGPRF